MERWTDKEVETLHTLKARGYSLEMISLFMGRKVGGIKKKLEYSAAVPLPMTAQRNCGDPAQRPCLKCRRSFQSAGFHNRLCENCTIAAESLSSAMA